VLHEDAGLLEGSRIEEELDPLPGGQAALGVELVDPLLAPALQDFLAAPSQLFGGVLGSQRNLLPDRVVGTKAQAW